jgi:hypothetical protein
LTKSEKEHTIHHRGEKLCQQRKQLKRRQPKKPHQKQKNQQQKRSKKNVVSL